MADVRSEHATESTAELPPGPTGHPLFPRAENETGPDLRRLDLIQIERLKEDGTWEACPRVFKASELQSWKDVVDLFGGGVYRARAQCKKSYQWQGMTERKEFNGPPPRPFCEEPPKARAAPSTSSPDTAPAAPPAYGPPGWAPPSGWAPPPGWTPPSGWAPPPGWSGMHGPSSAEPPAWMALMIKALDRPQTASNDTSLFAIMFKAQAEQNAAMLKAQADRDAMLLRLLVEGRTAPTGTPNPLEMIREIAPLLKNTTAPGQFMQGVELAKSLLQQASPQPPQEDFASTLANIMRTLSPQGMAALGGAAPAPSPAPVAPAAPAPAAPAAPVLGLEDVIRMAARDRNLAQRFIEEMRRHAHGTNGGAAAESRPPGGEQATSTPSGARPAAASPAPVAVAPAVASPAPVAVAPAAASPAPVAVAPAAASPAPVAVAPAAASSTPFAGERTASTVVEVAIPYASPSSPRAAAETAARAPRNAADVPIRFIADEDEEDGALSLSPEELLGSPELQAAIDAAGEDGRRGLLMFLTGQMAAGNGPSPGRGPGTA